MIGQFKLAQFDPARIQTLVEGLHAAGINVELVWKKRNKPVSGPEDGATRADLTANGKWVLRQSGRNGVVRLNKLPAEQRDAFCRCLKENAFYSAPNWGLGITLLVVYWLLLLLVALPQSAGLAGVLLTGGIITTISLGILATTRTPALHTIGLVILGVGAFVTALYSLLVLGMIKAIHTNYHYQDVMTATSEAPATA